MTIAYSIPDLKKRFIPLFSQSFCGVVGGADCSKATETPQGNLLSNLLIRESNDDDDDDDDASDDEDDDASDDDGDGRDKRDDDSNDGDDSNDDDDNELTTSRIINEYAASSVDGILEYYVNPRANSLSTANRNCVRDSLQVRRDQLENIVKNFAQIRLVISALTRLRNHVKSTIVSRILSVRPPDSCIDSFIKLRCKECIEDIPDTCQGACDAVVYGCLAPYSEGLREQFNLLWNSTNQIVNIANRLLANTGSLPQTLFGVNTSNATSLKNLVSREQNICVILCGLYIIVCSTTFYV